MASTEYLRPNAAGDKTQVDEEETDGSAHYTCVDEASADDDSTFVYNFAGGATYQTDLYNLSAHTGSGTINWIKVWARMESYLGSGAHGKTAIKTGGTEYLGAENNLTTSWASYSTQYTTNPKTSVAWTWDDLDALQAGCSLAGVFESSYSACTQVYVEVNYTPGGFVYISKVNGVASAAISKINGVLVAAISKFNGTAV